MAEEPKIRKISFTAFLEISEGMVFMGTGGELEEWVKGITEVLGEEDRKSVV